MILKGIVEFLDPQNLRGWAYLADQSDVQLNIKAKVNGAVVGQGRADVMRKDLARAGIGMGDHAFDLRFDKVIERRELERVEVVAVIPSGQEFRLNSMECGVTEVEIPLEHDARLPAAPCRLRVFQMPSVDTTQRPVFILGAARSGTSAMALGLLKCGEYQGFQEGHFLWMLQSFLETIRSFYARNGEDALPERLTMLSYAPYTYMASSVRALFVAAASEMFPTRKWIDKTPRPEMIAAARLMQELWPNARFIFMKRRGIENIVSRLVKFPQISFQDHCHDWAKSMETWLTVRDLLKSAALEVEQLALARAPDRVATTIGEFLEMPKDAVVRLARSLQDDLPEQSSEIRGPLANVAKLGWSVKQITEFRNICGSMMAAFGYGYGEEYFATPVASVAI
jgi:Sulfotransferase family